jgi:putative tryptophan/tyrosine transport system substrate-binding protein
MRRRHFIGLIGCAAAWPLAARGQQKARYPTIGLVGSASTDDEETRRSTRAFESACSEFGWVEGRNIHVVYRWAESSQMRAVVAELVASAPDVIIANGTSVLTAVREATNSIPVVSVGISDPEGVGPRCLCRLWVVAVASATTCVEFPARDDDSRRNFFDCAPHCRIIRS